MPAFDGGISSQNFFKLSGRVDFWGVVVLSFIYIPLLSRFLGTGNIVPDGGDSVNQIRGAEFHVIRVTPRSPSDGGSQDARIAGEGGFVRLTGARVY
jgi:hypothetical protein